MYCRISRSYQQQIETLQKCTNLPQQQSRYQSSVRLVVLQNKMKDYFSAKEVHLDDKCMMSAAHRLPLLATYGVDNVLHTINPLDGAKNTYQLMETDNYSAIALAPDGSHCLLARASTIFQYNFQTKEASPLVSDVCNGNITALDYGIDGHFLAVGSEEGKNVILQPRNGRKEKCRPGHSKTTVCISISQSEEFVASIGQDQHVIVYHLSAVDPHQEVARECITKLEDCSMLRLSFHKIRPIVFLPGERHLQRLELIDNHWQLSKCQLITHGQNIINLTQTVKENTLVTSSFKQTCIWNIRTQEKLFQISEFNLTTALPLNNTFFGMRDDGYLYQYTRNIKDEEPMDIQQQDNQSRLEFQEQQSEEKEDEFQEKRSVMEYQTYKKSKADKLITCLPQGTLTSATSMFENQRFLFVNQYGAVIQKMQANDEISVQVQFGIERPKKYILAHNRSLQHFDINPFGLVYASEKEVGLKLAPGVEGQVWQTTWNGIKGVALGSGWIAVFNEEEIRILDMCCYTIKSIAFDRQIIAVRAHQNLLVVVYHESIPMWGSQQLAMQLILINESIRESHLIVTGPVPIRPGAQLRSIHFSTEGMLISQDSYGNFRAFSLERGDWTPIAIENLEDHRKAWVVGVSNHNLLFWRTSSQDPEPTVAPRFDIETASFCIPTLNIQNSENQQRYEQLLWRRFQLDHEKARARLWGQLKTSRPQTSIFYQTVRTIISEKELAIEHEELDKKWTNLIHYYIKQGQFVKALAMAKSCIRSMDVVKNLVELFDSYNQRFYSILMEEHKDQKQKEIQYQQMQIFQFMQMRAEAEKIVKPKSNDIMRRPAKKMMEPIPSLSQSLNFNESDRMSNQFSQSQISMGSQVSADSKAEEVDNPFMKRKGDNQNLEAKKKEITDHVQKYGIKKKIDGKKGRM